MDGLAARVTARLRTALGDALAATLAAAVAWELAKALFGHPHPVFAAVTALICLAPGLPNHGRQAVGVILGVVTGIVVGEAALAAGDQARAQAALGSFSEVHASLAGLAIGIDNARFAATWSLRGRLARHDLRAMAARFGRRSTRTYAAALHFGSALATAMQRRPGGAPATLAPGITAAVALCDLGAPMAEPPPLPLAGIDDDWRRVLVRLSEAMEAIRELREAVPPA